MTGVCAELLIPLSFPLFVCKIMFVCFFNDDFRTLRFLKLFSSAFVYFKSNTDLSCALWFLSSYFIPKKIVDT